MRTVTKLQDIQVTIYHFRVSQGRYLTDIRYEELCREAIAEMGRDAEAILLATKLDLRRVRRKGRKVWRFLDRS